MLVSEIAALLDYEMVGDDCEIEGISRWDSAGEHEIAVVKTKEQVSNTKARVVLTGPVIMQTDKTLLITYESMECSLVRVCDVLVRKNILPDFSTPTKYKLNDNGYYVGENCNISAGAIVQPGVTVGDDVTIGDGCIIEPYVMLGSGTVLERNVYIGSGSKIGVPSFYHYYIDGTIRSFSGCGIVRISNNTRVGCNTVIQRGTISDTVIGANTMIGNGIDIGHDVTIGENCKIVSQTGIAGETSVKDNVLIYGQVGISNNIVIGNNVVIKGGTAVTKSVNDNEVVYGPFGRSYGEEMRFIAKLRRFFEGKEG